MIPSGITALDERLGGLIEHKPYVLTGGPGMGKTVACLAFLNAAFVAGEQALMITEDEPAELFAEARYLGMDVEQRIAQRSMAVLRYAGDFAARVRQLDSLDPVIAEIRRLMNGVAPRRVAVDSLAPFVNASDDAGDRIDAIVRFIASLGATAIITCPDDFDLATDARLRPLVERADAVLAMSRTAEGEHCLEIRQVSHAVPSTEPISFVIGAGAGIVRSVAKARRRADIVGREREMPLIHHEFGDGATPEPLSEHDFRNAVQAHIAGDRAPAFTVLTLRPAATADGRINELAEVVLSRLRVRDGDLAGRLDDGVAVYLHSTRRRDLDAFIGRVRREWDGRGNGDLRTDSAIYPSDGDRLASVLEAPPVSDASDELR